MSKPSRSIQDINNAYYRKAAELGDLEFKYDEMPGEMETIKSQLKELKKEMERAQAWALKEEQEKAKLEADKLKSNGAAKSNHPESPQQVAQQ